MGKTVLLAEEPASPTNEDFIRILDYDDLERRFHIYKYVPRFIHNYDYSTPQIRQMIGDKPVYAKANQHVKNFKNPGTRKTYITEIDLDTGDVNVREKVDKKEEKKKKKEARHESKDAKREARGAKVHAAKETRKEARETRTETRDEYRRLKEEQKDERKEEKEEYRRLIREHREQRKAVKHGAAPPYEAPALLVPAASHWPNEDDQLVFTNPFGPEQATLVPTQQPAQQPPSRQNSVRRRQNSVRTLQDSTVHRNSISEKLRDIIFPRKSGERPADTRNSLVKTLSYDQTQSTMTFNRGVKNNLLRFRMNESKGRRMSEQIGTYFFQSGSRTRVFRTRAFRTREATRSEELRGEKVRKRQKSRMIHV